MSHRNTIKAAAAAFIVATTASVTQVSAANIVQTAASTGQFNTLLAAAKAAGIMGSGKVNSKQLGDLGC